MDKKIGGSMFKIFFILAVLSSNLSADWHWSCNPPKKGQLVMFVLYGQDPDKVLMITHYDPKTMKEMLYPHGWWDVDKECLWDWIAQKYRIYYIPRNSESDYFEDL